MKATLVLNQKSEMGFFYGAPLDIEPEWASIDIDMGQIQIFDNDGAHQHLVLDDINGKIYDRVQKEGKILLIQVEDNDIRKPVKTHTVHLMVSQQV